MKSNENLITYINEINALRIDNSEIEIVNIFNQPKIIGALKSRLKWNKTKRVLTSCLKISIALSFSIIDITHIFRTLPSLIREFRDNLADNLHELVENYKVSIDDIQAVSKASHTSGTQDFKINYLFIKLLIELSNYDLSFEIYRSNILYIEHVYANTVAVEQKESDIILKLLALAKDEMFNAFKSFLKCISLENNIDKTNFETIFKNEDEEAEDEFVSNIHMLIKTNIGERSDKPIIYFSIFEESQKIFKELDKSFIKLNFI